MKTNIKEITDEGIDLEFNEEAKAIDLRHEQLKELKDLKVKLHLQKEGDIGFFVDGKISVSWDLLCSRCLKSFNQKINLTFEREYRLGIEEAKKEELDEDETNIVYFTGEEIDFSDDVRQDLLLAIPIKTLCREKCEGLCPVCGKNLNLIKCNCKQEKFDDRWEKLASLKDKLKN